MMIKNQPPISVMRGFFAIRRYPYTFYTSVDNSVCQDLCYIIIKEIKLLCNTTWF